MNISVLVVDDEKKIVEVIRSYLEKDSFVVFEAYTGKTALDIFEKETIDIVILDLMLPDISGEDICREIRKTSNIPIIMLTAKSSENSLLNGLNIGADDYITKPFSPKELIARTKTILKRIKKEDVSEISFNKGDLVINEEERTVKKLGKEINLTANEFKLLLAFSKYPKKVYTRDELITTAFGYEYEGFERTIDSHIKNLRKKIEENNIKPGYIVTVHGVGYSFNAEKN